jgi:hypothetical protein
MDTEKVKRWLEIVSDVSNILGLQQWFTPPILAAVASVLGVTNNAPPLFFMAIIVIVVVACGTNIALAIIKYKRWLNVSLSEDEHIVKILNCLRRIHSHIEQASGNITKSEANRSTVPEESEHFLTNLEVSLDKALECLPLGKNRKSKQEYVKMITGINFRNRKQVLNKTSEIDIVLASSLFDILKADKEYDSLKSELYGYISELAVSNDKISDLIDGIIKYSCTVFSGMSFQRLLIDYYGFRDDNYKRNERGIESMFNKELEKVRKGIRAVVMKGV